MQFPNGNIWFRVPYILPVDIPTRNLALKKQPQTEMGKQHVRGRVALYMET